LDSDALASECDSLPWLISQVHGNICVKNCVAFKFMFVLSLKHCRELLFAKLTQIAMQQVLQFLISKTAAATNYTNLALA